ncbi:EAL and HDOD domain-containing protein [Thiomicrorhabdus aquaedulcis]|uniref:EAL and HDOD domain-containing protein n=1 Tax=Thiomicrorhabdus aquaedulcis TaxID=2211106 RepID=UPI000FDB45DC|nr:EAL domain-containing protein [Thiomicrorhabdus aquaedulcis]
MSNASLATTPAVFMGRQPILDRHMQVFAYELCFYSGDVPSAQSTQEIADLMQQAYAQMGFALMAGSPTQTAFLNVPKELLTPEHLACFGESHAHQMVLQIPNTVSKDIEVLKNLKTLKAQGHAVALSDFNGEATSIKLASISEFAKINSELQSELQLKTMLDTLHARGVKVIAEKVETEERFEFFKKLGFDYFQGYFFTKPIMRENHVLSGNQLTLLQLLAKVNDPNTDFVELSNIIKHDVGLSHKLLVAINHPATQIPVQVHTVADGLKYMGLKRLKFWVNMLMLSGMEGVPAELLISSLARAKFCELLAESTGLSRDKDSYFLVGLFSNLDGFFKVPMQTVLQQLPLGEVLRESLLTKKGAMGEAINVLEALELANHPIEQLTYNALTISDLSSRFMSANVWAHQVVSG